MNRLFMREYDLRAVAPVIDEAKSRQDLSRVLARLRRDERWTDKGWSRSKIIDGVEDSFIHHREHAEKMMAGGDGFSSAAGIRGVKFRAGDSACEMVIDGSHEWNNTPHTYTTTIRFNNYKLIRKLPETTWPEKARMLLEDNLHVDCDCDAFRYYYRYGATKKGFALVAEKRAARKRNPGQRGTVCKHLEHALRYLGGQYSTIAGAMKRHHQDIQEADMSTIARINQFLGESPMSPPEQSNHDTKLTMSHGELYHLLTASGHNVGTWRHDPQGLAAYAQTVIDNHKVEQDRAAKGKIGESKALFEGHLHEDVGGFGIIDVIAGLVAECSKKGMARTANVLKMAIGTATTEGACRRPQTVAADQRSLPVVQDTVTEGEYHHNALMHARSDNGAPYCPKCAAENPQHKYELASGNIKFKGTFPSAVGYSDDKCDVCGKPPFIPKGTKAAYPETTTARIF